MSTILVDVDGVVGDTHVSWLHMYNQDYHDNLTVEQITRWELHEFVVNRCGKKIYDYLDREDFYDNCPMVENALLGVKTLRAQGHRVIFVSAGFHESKIRGLAKWGFLAEFLYKDDHRPSTATDVVLANDKSLIRGDFMIDDRIENLLYIPYPTARLLFTQPWNTDFEMKYYGRGMRRVTGWLEIVEYFR